jgi:hypothetical protein
MTSMDMGLREMDTLHMVDIQLSLHLEVRVNNPFQTTPPIGNALGKACMGMGMRLRETGTLHEADIPVKLQSRIKTLVPETPGIRVSTVGSWVGLPTPKIHIRL